MGNKTSFTVEGIPDMDAALKRYADQLVGPEGEAALRAAGRVIAVEWAADVPVGAAPHDPHPGAYQRALEADDAVRVGRDDDEHPWVSVAPAKLADLPDSQQPQAYAGVLEYGDSDQPPQPSARRAFEAAQGKAVQTLSDELGKIKARPA